MSEWRPPLTPLPRDPRSSAMFSHPSIWRVRLSDGFFVAALVSVVAIVETGNWAVGSTIAIVALTLASLLRE